MKIAAITKYQAGQLRELLDEAGWSQRELAFQSGVPIHRISNFLNMRRKLDKSDRRDIVRAFKRKAGISATLNDDWPEGWEGMPKGKGTVTQIKEVPNEVLIADYSREVKQLEAPEEGKRERLTAFINELTEGENPIWVEMLWLHEAEGWSLRKIGEQHGGITAECVRQKIRKLIRNIHEKQRRKERAAPPLEPNTRNEKYFSWTKPELEAEPKPSMMSQCLLSKRDPSPEDEEVGEDEDACAGLEAEDWFRWVVNGVGSKTGEILHPLEVPKSD